MAFSRASYGVPSLDSFNPSKSSGYQRVNFEDQRYDFGENTENYGNYFGIGDLAGKYQASFENSFKPDEVAINAAINQTALNNLTLKQQAELDVLGLQAYGVKEANEEIASEARKLAREKAQEQMNKSKWGLAATIAGTAASFIPGVGAIAGPAVNKGVQAVGNQVG
jgi:hypothetical protein